MISLLLFAACQPHPVPVVASQPEGYLVIAHTNDLHAHFEPNRADWLDGHPDIGGFGEIAAHVASLHEEKGDDHVLYLDGGDIMTGTPLMEFASRGVRGGAMLEFMESAGMDAWVLGNHEFDIGYDHISSLVAASNIPVLSANLDSIDQTGRPAIAGLQDHVIIERAGLRIGIFGLTTDSLARLTGTDAADRMNVIAVEEAAAEQVALLEPQVDLVVALTHIGVETDKRIAKDVPGIDLIVGGHSHTPLTEPVKVGDTWVVQAGCYARQLGVTEMTVKDGRIVTFSAELRDLVPGVHPIPESAGNLVKQWDERIEEHFAEVIGTVATGDLTRSREAETTLGRWSADMVKFAASADVGIYNPGGLRSDMVEGTLTRGGLYQVFPFSNDVVRFDVTGAELVGLLLRNARSELQGNHPVMQMSGVRVTWRMRSGAPELVEARVGNAILDPDTTYTAATNSFVADRWNYNLGFEPRNLVSEEITVFQAAIKLAAQGPIVPPPNPRMVRID
jgi:5'-nucleotidase / UDP-sugar diphosphatase